MIARGLPIWTVLLPGGALTCGLIHLLVLQEPFLLVCGSLLLLLMAPILIFFRDPKRSVGEGVVSPADGKVVAVERRKGNWYFISIFMNIHNVHVNRAPCSGAVEFIKYTPGKFHNAFGKKASTENENNMIGIANGLVEKGVAVRQIAGAVARRIVCDCRVEDRLERGQRIGMIKFGSRTELYIPASADFELLVKPGDKVKGGETVLGILRCEK